MDDGLGNRAQSKLWKTSHSYALDFSSIVLDPGNKVKEMSLTTNCQMSFTVVLYCPKYTSSP